MPGEVEGNDAKAGKCVGVIEERAILAAVGASRMQAQERNALPGLFDIEPVRLAPDGQPQVAADDGLEAGLGIDAHRAAPDTTRGSASKSLK